jgi:hypothetical protein
VAKTYIGDSMRWHRFIGDLRPSHPFDDIEMEARERRRKLNGIQFVGTIFQIDDKNLFKLAGVHQDQRQSEIGLASDVPPAYYFAHQQFYPFLSTLRDRGRLGFWRGER